MLRRLRNRVLGPVRTKRRKAITKGAIVYYPVFHSQSEITNHYHRARWYLPYVPGKLHRVSFFQNFSAGAGAVGPRPEYMCDDGGGTDHLEVRRGGLLAAIRALWSAHVILVWKNPRYMPVIWVKRLLGATVLNVTTDDPTAREYGTYCKILWAYLTSREERDAILEDDAAKFNRYAERIRSRDPKQACVMGNGPSLENVFKFDFSDSLTMVCNSTVADDRIVEHVRPAFVAACDVVSHMGVSAQAADFRKQLFRALDTYEFLFVTTATFGYLTTLHYPEYRDRMILIEQTSTEPVYDLFSHYATPMLDSVMNIVMLPIAATFCDMIWFLGADGKSQVRSNEDFWAHAQTAGTDHDLVRAGHLCHPMFDVHRQQITYDRYNESIEKTVETGEAVHGKVYRALFPSNTPVLAPRAIPEELRAGCDEESPCSLTDLSRLIREGGTSGAHTSDAQTRDTSAEASRNV